MTFTSLDPAIAKALNECGYTTPTPIQAQAIPSILAGKDLIASAQTGSGKTAAFVLPALQRLATGQPNSKPRVLVLTPTRELADQITNAAGKYGKYLRFNIVSIVGGMPYGRQLQALKRRPDIIVATPGRLMDHMNAGRLDLSGVEMLVLDEADRMLDMGFIEDVEFIAQSTPNSRQTLLFSATVDNNLARLAKAILKEPEQVFLANKKTLPVRIEQRLYMVDDYQHKSRLLAHLLSEENMHKAIIFSATKIEADRLAQKLCDQGYEALPLHGDLRQNQRNRTLEQLRRGRIQFIVATDVAARGIDINGISHVVNYDLPKSAEDYVHRIGRTGRAGESGVAISLALPADMRFLQQIERFTEQRLERSVIPGLEPTRRADNFSTGRKPAPRRGFSNRSTPSGRSSSPGRSAPSGNSASRERRSFSEGRRFSDDRGFSERGRGYSSGNGNGGNTAARPPVKVIHKSSARKRFNDRREMQG